MGGSVYAPDAIWNNSLFQANGLASEDETGLFKMVSTESSVVTCLEAFSPQCIHPQFPLLWVSGKPGMATEKSHLHIAQLLVYIGRITIETEGN